ncbi:MAG: endonuclease III domain-containing protein [Phycisphaerae bacterium]
MTSPDVGRTLRDFYDALLEAFGPQHWWPGDTRDETIIGAVLTQNTAWGNVERAIDQIKSANLLSLAALHAVNESTLAQLIRPAGTYRVKAGRLKSLISWIDLNHGGDLEAMFATPLTALRESLLTVPGVGPETADAILLYAGNHPTFVVDAYTQRVLRRHFLSEPRPLGSGRSEPRLSRSSRGDNRSSYARTKELFERNIAPDAQRYGEYHALLVEVGKRFCRTRARCDQCPLRHWPHDAEL